MELFVKVERTGATTEGTRSDGSKWHRTQVVFREAGGERPQSLILDLYEDAEGVQKLGLTPGAVGTITFSISTREYQGRTFNDLRYRNWSPYQTQQAEEQKPAAPIVAPTPATDNATEAKAPEEDSALPF